MNDNYYEDNFDNENFNDTNTNDNQNFNEFNHNNDNESVTINGKPLTFKTGDVAKMLGETPAMIRYYCREFEEFLGIDHSPGKHRIFTEREIKYLRYIIYLLKEKNLSVKQAKEFLSTPQGKLMAPIENSEDKVKIFVEMISTQLKKEISEFVRNEIQIALKEMQKPIDKISSTLDKTIQSNESLKATIEKMVTYTVASNKDVKRKLNEINTTFEKINEINTNLSKVDQFIMEFRQKYAQREELSPKRGFFSKIFGRK